jgi:hypothetical protein
MGGHRRFRAGAWQLTVERPKDPITCKRRQVHRTVEPNTKAGEKVAHLELAKLIVEVESQRATGGRDGCPTRPDGRPALGTHRPRCGNRHVHQRPGVGEGRHGREGN